jgi:hypothetical protein
MQKENNNNLSFWHPVGSHASETLEVIISRKKKEIMERGYTLWSFSPATFERVSIWREELQKQDMNSCSVICCGDTTVDPHNGKSSIIWAEEMSVDMKNWTKIPKMTSYHRPANKNGILASAFMVSNIEVLKENIKVLRPNNWFCVSENGWKSSPVPTRGEYLVRTPMEADNGRAIRLILKVKEPFVIWVR